MRRKTFLLVLLQLLLICNNLADGNKSKTLTEKSSKSKTTNHNHNIVKSEINLERVKRSLDIEDDEKPFWANRGKKQTGDNNKMSKDPPFWGNRGRRHDSSSSENKIDDTDYVHGSTCKYSCFDPFYNILKYNYGKGYKHSKERRDEAEPFWGTRGRRNSVESFEVDDNQDAAPFWGNRGRRQDDDSPFWGNRGRREDQPPFWGNRGRRDDLSPFWGARGRREDYRGQSEDDTPFWGNRGRREDDTPFWGNRGRRKEGALKDSLTDAISHVQENIEQLTRLRRNFKEPFFTVGTKTSFWSNQGRDSKLKHLFNGKSRTKLDNQHSNGKSFSWLDKFPESKALYDDRMYAEQPQFILVDRRSSMEDDPFVISRGKKKNKMANIVKAARDRRGIIEEIVKSVKTDPYYIARGKKDGKENDIILANNLTANHEELEKAKALICSTIDLMNMKREGNKIKREIDDNDRDRRTILKKLAAQLQLDPYFVSRGKKNSDSESNEDYIEDFIRQISEMCI